ncbi:MAG: cytochrome c [Phycisphaerales bacterium]|nr:cytochrome c [Phycisphaerales bacterium]
MSAPPLLLAILAALCVLRVLGGGILRAAEPEVLAKDLPRLPAVEAKDAVKTFKVRPGFAMELAASEPNVVSPVAMAFDENGRLFVVEMIDYSERRDEKLGRIRLLEDTDGDGVFDKATVYAEGLPWPTAVFPWKGGVFVGCTPDILYFKDTDGDGKADERRVVFTGFGTGVKKLNVQALLNSFNWGLDNRIHGAASFNAGSITRPGSNDKPVEMRGKGFAFDPASSQLIAENGGGQHGLSFDDWGRMYVGSNSRHIQTFAYDARYADRNPAFAMPTPLLDIAVDGPAAEVYRASPEEPWRVIRTKWRVSGISSGPIEGGGRSAGYFTGATGVTIYRGNAYGPDYEGDAFIGDAGGNLVHRKKIRPHGVIVKAERAADEQNREFVASTDTWFRPVQFANGPDGCLYVIDMYRETIEHPWSLPESLKKHLDLNSGNDRGRIYRVVPNGFKRPAKLRLGEASMEELVRTLAHPNGWHRDTAARLIYEKQDKSAVRLLEALLASHGAKPQAADERTTALGGIHAMYALEGLGALNAAHLLTVMDDSNEHVRQHAIKLSERFLEAKEAPAALVNKLGEMVLDPSMIVRYQLAFTLGYLRDAERPARLAKLAAKDGGDTSMAAAVLNSAGDRAIDLFRLLNEPALREEAGARELSPRLAEIIGARGFGDEIAGVIEVASDQKDAARMMALARALGAGLHKAGIPLEAEKGQLILDRAEALANDTAADGPTRLAAIGVLGCVSWDHYAATLLPLMDPRQGQAVQVAALGALEQLDRGALAGEILRRWDGMTPRLREAAAGVMVKRPARARALLEAIQSGKVRRGDLSGSQAAALRQSSDKAVKELAAKVLVAPAGKRDDVVKAFAAAIDLKGDPKHGHEIYLAKCSSCHRLAGEGNALGPDLETVKNTGKEKMLTSILDPNREVAPNYTAYIVETKDGDSQVGVIASETAASVTLRMALGMEVVLARDAIKSMHSAGLSMMPEGLEEGMKAQDLADLMEYVITAK